MKNIFRSFISLGFLIGMAVSFAACKKADCDINYGYAYIYMPQAINVSTGTNNNYPVPSGTDSTTYNYIIDNANNKLKVILGTSLSGETPSSGYTVNIGTNTDTVNQLIAGGTLDASTVLMPASIYSLPSQLSVVSGSRGNTFYLSIDINALKTTYANKKLALAVTIGNPTKYTLNESLTTTIVIVNVSSLGL